MNDFLWGVVALPVAVIAAAVAAYFAAGSWTVVEKWIDLHFGAARRSDWQVNANSAAYVARARRLGQFRAFGWRFIVMQETPATIRPGLEADGSDREGILHRRIASAIQDANGDTCRDYPWSDQ